MKADDIKVIKSSNEVRQIARSGLGRIVERTKGESAGKQMWCPSRALVDSLELGNE